MKEERERGHRSRSRSRRRGETERNRSRGRRSPSTARERLQADGRSRHRSRRSRSPQAMERHERRPRSRSPLSAPARPRQRIGHRPCWYAKEYDPIQVGSIDGTDSDPHDRAIVRAMNTPFNPSRDVQIQGDPYATLFVGRLSFATTEETLRTIFEAFGRIRRVRLVRDIVTQESKGYAFIEFERERDFRVAYQTAHRTVIDGRTILVDYERSRVMPGWKPRRLGGGLGGKKESGQLRFGGRDHPFKPPR